MDKHGFMAGKMYTCCGTFPRGCWRPQWWASRPEPPHSHTLGRGQGGRGWPSGAHLHRELSQKAHRHNAGPSMLCISRLAFGSLRCSLCEDHEAAWLVACRLKLNGHSGCLSSLQKP